ncbi:MAG: HEAT repeat domain-containing protein [Gemmatimonadaceae bacterium]|nr:HEAT repeat domain-containing protein [Gemmatimonadaceae bacterium]
MSTRERTGVGSLALLLAGWSVALEAQSIGERVQEVRDGAVRFSFAARPGVCGSGQSWWTDARSGNRYGSFTTQDVEIDCAAGPVRVVVTRSQLRTTSIRTYVGGRWSAQATGVDLGTVTTRDASAFLLSVAESGDAGPAEAAMAAATLADSVDVWPTLLRVARAPARPLSVRKQAVFWVAQAASDKVVGALSELADQDPNVDIRKQAVFALSQRPANEGVPALMRIARDRQTAAPVRKSAYFWLGQSNDPRALAFLEAALLAP